MGLANGRKKERCRRLHYSDLEICQIYAEALENETGMPVEDLEQVFDYDNYILTYDSAEDKMIIKICGVYVQFLLLIMVMAGIQDIKKDSKRLGFVN